MHSEPWSSLVLIRVYPNNGIPIGEKGNTLPIGYVFVADFGKFGPNALWKLPGGHKRSADETQLGTAARETHGETGLQIPEKAFQYLGQRHREQPVPHEVYYFAAAITESDRDWMNENHPENEGEVPRYFTVQEFHELVRSGKFMPAHYEALVEFAAVFPRE